MFQKMKFIKKWMAIALTGILLSVSLWAHPAKALAATYEPNYPDRYMGGEATLTTAPNGAIIYDKALEAANATTYNEPTVENLGNGIWIIGGYSIVNCIVIEAPDGLIVYDTGDSAEQGKRFREVIESQISTEPIKAIIYSHSHYALGGGEMVDDPDSVMVIGHPKLNETVEANLQSGGDPSALITLTYDQSIRGILRGLRPDELRYFIYKPQHLADAPYNAETYGETPWYPPAIFYYQMGWYDRDPAKFHSLPKKQHSGSLL